MTQLFANAARSTLAAAITAEDTTLTLVAGGGERFPGKLINQWYYLTLQDGDDIEIVRVTAHGTNSDEMTIERGQQDTKPRAFPAGSAAGIRATAADMSQYQYLAPTSNPEFIGQVSIPRGSVAEPGLVMSGEPNTGFYSYTGHLGVTCNGEQVITFGHTQDQETAGNGITLLKSAYLCVDIPPGDRSGLMPSCSWVGNEIAWAVSNAAATKANLTGGNLYYGTQQYFDGMRIQYAYMVAEYNIGVSGTAKLIDFANGNKQRMTLSGNCAISFSFPGPGNYQLIIVEGASAFTVTWPSGTKFIGAAAAPAINTVANSETLVSIYNNALGATYIAIAKVGAA